MTTRLPVLLAALVVLATLLAAPMAGLAGQAETPTDADTDATPPGAQLAGVVGVEDAELAADLDERIFGVRVAQAAGDDARADVVADRLGEVEQRLGELEAERERLAAARANGSMSEGEYRARVATLAAESHGVERAANQTAAVAAGLDPAALDASGVNVTAIRTLADRADGLTGPAVAEIARSIAGGNAGGPPAGDRTPLDDAPGPDDAGPDRTDADPDDPDDPVTQGPEEAPDQPAADNATGAPGNGGTTAGEDGY